MSQFQDTINHPSRTGQTKRAAGYFQAGKTIDNFPQATTVEFCQLAEIEDDAGVAVADQLIESQLELLALDSNLERPG